jgi:hypothetical protein
MKAGAVVPIAALLVCAALLATPGDAGEAVAEPTAQQAFWDNLRAHCGAAFAGGRTVARPGDDMLTGGELLIAHFRECGDEVIKIPFHIEQPAADGAAAAWDRSRTWVFTRHADRLEIRHDHRLPDGTEDEHTWYGGFSESAGTATVQEFIYHGRQDPSGLRLGWRIEIHPADRFVYGTIRGDQWTWCVEFDLSRAVMPPPAPWGHE